MLKHIQELVHEEIRNTLGSAADFPSEEDSPSVDIATAKQPIIEARAIRLLPSTQCMLEILEDVEPTPGVIEALKERKAAGYGLVLDDYAGQKNLAPFLPLVDIVKLDVLNRDGQAIADLADSLVNLLCTRLAEKVVDERTRKLCQEHGCLPPKITPQELFLGAVFPAGGHCQIAPDYHSGGRASGG